MKTENKLIGTGIITAIAASLCCITPVLTLVAGASGLASSFSWLAPARPYFIGLTVFILGFAWYQKIKPKKQVDCQCETENKPSFFQTKTFLGLITVFTGLMLAFPSYSHIFYPKTETQAPIANQSHTETMEFTISGMTCEACGDHVNHEVNQLPGIIKSAASYENKNAVVTFDNSKTSVEEIQKAINSTGYIVTKNQEK